MIRNDNEIVHRNFQSNNISSAPISSKVMTPRSVQFITVAFRGALVRIVARDFLATEDVLVSAYNISADLRSAVPIYASLASYIVYTMRKSSKLLTDAGQMSTASNSFSRVDTWSLGSEFIRESIR